MPRMAARPYRSVKVAMEYRGKQYSVIQSLDGKWKWSIEIDGHTKSGKAANRLVGIRLAEDAIDRALAPKKKRLTQPPDR